MPEERNIDPPDTVSSQAESPDKVTDEYREGLRRDLLAGCRKAGGRLVAIDREQLIIALGGK